MYEVRCSLLLQRHVPCFCIQFLRRLKYGLQCVCTIFPFHKVQRRTVRRKAEGRHLQLGTVVKLNVRLSAGIVITNRVSVCLWTSKFYELGTWKKKNRKVKIRNAKLTPSPRMWSKARVRLTPLAITWPYALFFAKAQIYPSIAAW